MKYFEYEGVNCPVPDGSCSNCKGKAHQDHPDLCCVCFAIAFGAHDHDQEHVDARRNGTLQWHRRGAFLGYIPTFTKEAVQPT